MATSILPPRAAIYARKSTDDSDRDAENKSVTRQVEHARAFAKKHGWTVDDEHVYVDDNVSGAEYTTRRGLARLMAVLPKRGKPPFEVLVMSESSRLGRDMTRNAAFMVSILESAVRIFYYLTGEEEKADTPEQKVMLTLRSYASEVERLKARQRSRDALQRKAQSGFNCGGRIFGYRNVPVESAPGVRSHTDFAIDASEAETVRRIFRAYAGGHGHVSIAKALNGAPAYGHIAKQYFNGQRPAPPRKGTGSWAPSSVRQMLYNQRYAGTFGWGLRRKVYRNGNKAQLKHAAPQLQVQRPELRIIDEKLWAAVQGRLQAVRKTYVRDTNGQLWGRPGTGVESRYLLSGLSECGCCAHNVVMLGGRTGHGTPRRRSYYYGCAYAATRGPTVCTNTLKAPLEAADALVLDTIRARVLTPKAVDFTVDSALRLLAERQRAHTDEPARLAAASKKEQGKLTNYVRAVGEGTAPPSVMAEIRKLEASITAKEYELATLTLEQPNDLDIARTKRAFRARLDQFNDLLLSNTTLARQALRKLLAGRIRFLPTASGYHLSWQLTLGPLLETGYIASANPTGFEPVSGT